MPIPFDSCSRSGPPWRSRLLACTLALLAAGCREVPTEALRFLELEIEAPATTLDVGETLKFGVAAVSSGGSRLELVGLNWRSSDPLIAVIEDGRVSGLRPGSAFVHVHVGGLSDSMLVTVRPAPDRPARLSESAPPGCWASGGPLPGQPTIC